MKKKHFFTGLVLFLFSFPSLGQNDEARIFSDILKSQKDFYSRNIKKVNKEKYVSILNLAKKIRPQVVLKINTIDSYFLKGNDKLNLVEGYDLAHGEIYGMIWKTDLIYTYVYHAMENTPIVTPKKVSELSEDQKNIFSNFNDWKNAIFINQECGKGRNGGLYYFASKATYLPKQVVKTIAFCY